MGTAIYRDPALPLLRLSNGVDSGPGVFILLAVLPAALSHVRLTFVDQRRRRVSWCSARTEASRPSVREPGIWWTSYAVSTLYASSGPGSCIFLVSTSTSLVDVTVDFAGAPLAVELARPHPPEKCLDPRKVLSASHTTAPASLKSESVETTPAPRVTCAVFPRTSFPESCWCAGTSSGSAGRRGRPGRSAQSPPAPQSSSGIIPRACR